jgi:hypothetical protein
MSVPRQLTPVARIKLLDALSLHAETLGPDLFDQVCAAIETGDREFLHWRLMCKVRGRLDDRLVAVNELLRGHPMRAGTTVIRRHYYAVQRQLPPEYKRRKFIRRRRTREWLRRRARLRRASGS